MSTWALVDTTRSWYSERSEAEQLPPLHRPHQPRWSGELMNPDLHRQFPIVLFMILITASFTGCRSIRVADTTTFRTRNQTRISSPSQEMNERVPSKRPLVVPIWNSGIQQPRSVATAPPLPQAENTSLDPVLTLVPLNSTNTESPTEPQTYIVKKGDTLSGIARKAYGEGASWKTVYDANRHILTSPNDLRPGMELIIP
jgi:LysM repeat protein